MKVFQATAAYHVQKAKVMMKNGAWLGQTRRNVFCADCCLFGWKNTLCWFTTFCVSVINRFECVLAKPLNDMTCYIIVENGKGNRKGHCLNYVCDIIIFLYIQYICIRNLFCVAIDYVVK